MPVPSAISDLSTTPGSNSPVGADAPSVLDDHIRTVYAFIKTLDDTKLAAIADASVSTAKIADSAVTTAKIAADAVTFAKLQNIATARFLGRTTAGSGDVEELTASAFFTAVKQAASTTDSGVAELMTNAEAQSGSDPARVATGANLGATVIGIGQTWQNVTGSRAFATDYTNSTGRPIQVAVSINHQGTSNTATMLVAGVTVFSNTSSFSTGSVTFPHSLSAIVPAGATYRVNVTGSVSLVNWSELR